MIKMIPFKPEHIKLLSDFGGQVELLSAINEIDFQDFCALGPSATVMDGEDIIGCAGLIEAHKLRATVWAIFQSGNPRGFAAAYKHLVKRMMSSPYRRIEAYVNPRNRDALRLVKISGFQLERAYIPFYFPDGGGASEWALYH